MKKATLINSEISYAISKLGHFDGLTICDAGLPIPEEAQRIDLALAKGIPTFLETLKVVVSEMEVESVELAEEFAEVSPDMCRSVVIFFQELEEKRGRKIPVNYVSHEQFKLNTAKSVAVIRTGEFTPYANITLKAGVSF